MQKIRKILVLSVLIVVFIPLATGNISNFDTAFKNKITTIETYTEIERTENKVLSVDKVIGDITVKYWEHILDNVIIKGDYILLHLDTQNGAVLKYKNEWTSIELPLNHNLKDGFEPANYFWKQKICFLDITDTSPFYILDTQQEYPLTCWEVRHHDGTTALYNQHGCRIGKGIPTPSEGFTVSGWVMQSDPDNYKEFRENADEWFQQWTTSTVGLSLPTPSTISSHISNPNVDYFYVMAHGNQNFFQADNEGSYYYSSTLSTDMNNRDAMTFAFIGTCQSMTSTGPGTFSYEFRKGKTTDTVTIGFDHMETCPGWQYEYYWQNSMFENMSKGLTIKESFDKATAEYPTIAPAVVFLGDESLKIPQPDLECSGDITWTDITPGDTATDTFTIENRGETNSVLCWEIVEYPNWGSWNFNPSKGNNVREEGPITIEVSVIAPEEKETSYDGEVKIVNIFDNNDQCTILVSLTTPKNKDNNTPLIRFLRNLMQEHPHLSLRLEGLLQRE
jgi:hypothetical protein